MAMHSIITERVGRQMAALSAGGRRGASSNGGGIGGSAAGAGSAGNSSGKGTSTADADKSGVNAYSITSDCIGCGACAKNCPVAAISGEAKQQHAIDPDVCVRCGTCGRLCPKGAILDVQGNPTQRIAKKLWPHPVFDKSCAGCSLCVVNCPKHCLQISEPAYHGDVFTRAVLARPEDCLGCGLCVMACPIEAVWLEAPEGETQ